MVLPKDFEFLRSVRFWKLFIVAFLLTLEQQGVLDSGLSEAVARVLEIALGGSVVLRTVDRFGENVGK